MGSTDGTSSSGGQDIREPSRWPSYLQLMESGELGLRAKALESQLAECNLCARHCGVDRIQSLRGAICQTGTQAIVHSHGPLQGGEHCLRGSRGSGAIYLSWCNLNCATCQNYLTRWKGGGRAVTTEELAGIMLELQDRGCHNINLVSPSHIIAQTVAAVAMAAERGLRLPLVYNSCGYDDPAALRLLDGIVDIYMVSMKYDDNRLAKRFSGIPDYVEANRTGILEMHRQTGDLHLDEQGLARRGLIVRHLVLPDGIAGTDGVLRFVAEHISRNTYISVLGDYQPWDPAKAYPEINRPITRHEFSEALMAAERHGLTRLDQGTATRMFDRWA